MEDKKIPAEGEEISADEAFGEGELCTLLDEDGTECQFECVGKYEEDGVKYFAMLPIEEEQTDEYVILKLTVEDGEEVLVSVDDDEEFDKIAGIFDQILFDEIDYDGEDDGDKK